MTRQLLWDVSRCLGENCRLKDECLRHEQLSNMGPRTPVVDSCVRQVETSKISFYPDFMRIKRDD